MKKVLFVVLIALAAGCSSSFKPMEHWEKKHGKLTQFAPEVQLVHYKTLDGKGIDFLHNSETNRYQEISVYKIR
jgi:hypothetical protein